jgi:hypothetical protein
MTTEARTAIQPLPFADFMQYFKREFELGEHVTILGHTGSGKTSLAFPVLSLRKYVIMLATKQKDPLLTKAKDWGFHVVRDGRYDPRIFPRTIVWPPIEKRSDIPMQQWTIYSVLDRIYSKSKGSTTLYIDEVSYVAERLKLKAILADLWQQGRSNDTSMVAATQRPYYIPQEAYQSATHIFMAREIEKRNLDRLKEISGGVDKELLKYTLQTIPKHDFIYANTRDGVMFRINVRK